MTVLGVGTLDRGRILEEKRRAPKREEQRVGIFPITACGKASFYTTIGQGMKQLFVRPLSARSRSGHRSRFGRFLCTAAVLAISASGYCASIALAQEEDLPLKFFDLTEGRLAFTLTRGESRDIYLIDFGAL